MTLLHSAHARSGAVRGQACYQKQQSITASPHGRPNTYVYSMTRSCYSSWPPVNTGTLMLGDVLHFLHCSLPSFHSFAFIPLNTAAFISHRGELTLESSTDFWDKIAFGILTCIFTITLCFDLRIMRLLKL